MEKKIIITGANGFIGFELINYFSKRNFKVVAFVYSPVKVAIENVEYVQYDMNKTVDELSFENADYIIHCAYLKSSKNNDTSRINIESTKRLLEISRKYKLKKFVFLSSFSAHKDALSNYGKTKFELEKIFDKNSDLVIKPGLVLGNGGLFKNIESIIKKNKFIPLIDGGKQALQTLHIDELVRCIDFALKNDISGKYAIAEKLPIKMKAFYKAVAKKLNKKVIWIYFHYFFANILLCFFEFIRISFSVSKENLLGLKQMKSLDVEKDLKIFNLEPKSCFETLEVL